MKRVEDVVLAPRITEKGTLVGETGNHFVFQVDRSANKDEIRKAVERLFRVKVERVRTANFAGKWKRVGQREGQRSRWKKAYVTLARGHAIDFFEGV